MIGTTYDFSKASEPDILAVIARVEAQITRTPNDPNVNEWKDYVKQAKAEIEKRRQTTMLTIAAVVAGLFFLPKLLR